MSGSPPPPENEKLGTGSPVRAPGDPTNPWKVEREDVRTTRGDLVPTWWVWRAPSHYLAQLDTEVEALAVRDALNHVAALGALGAPQE